MWRPPHGALDGTFGSSGTTIATVGPNPDTANELALDGSGRILAVGKTQTGTNQQFLVGRFTADGVLDTSFSTDGLVGFGWGTNADWGTCVQPGAASDIIAVGKNDDGIIENIGVARLDDDGTLDTTFSGDGKNEINVGGIERPGSCVRLDDGSILVAGSNGDGAAMFVLKLQSDGSTDLTFGGGDGVVTVNVTGASDEGTDVAVASDGSIFLVGYAGTGTTYDLAVAKFSSTGVLDTAWNGDGWNTIETSVRTTSPSNDRVNAVAIDPSTGDLYVAGRADGTSNGDMMVARIDDATGGLVAGFGSGGVARIDFGIGADQAADLALQPDGTILVGGEAATASNGIDFALARLTSTGALDTTFDGDGKALSTVSSTDNPVKDMIIGTEGRAILFGQEAGDLVLQRFDTTKLGDFSTSSAWTASDGAFGACVESVGANTTARWTAAGSGNCTIANTGNWRAVPNASNGTATIAAATTGTGRTANIRFGVGTPTTQPPGKYVAPITLEVISPDVSPPVNTVPPTIIGTIVEREKINSDGTWTGPGPITYTYRHLRCDSAGNNCTERTTGKNFVLKTADIGFYFKIEVTAMNPGGITTATTPLSSVVLPAKPYLTYDDLVLNDTTDNPEAFWRLGESSGATTAANAGTGGATYNGTYSATGVTLSSAGALNPITDTAATFNGTTGHVAFTDAQTYKPNYFTFSAWFRTSTPGQTGTSTVYRSGRPTGLGLELVNGALRAFKYDSTPTLYATTSPTATYNDGNWHHVAVRAGQDVDSMLRLYVDGEEVSSADAPNNTSYSATGSALGRDGNNAAQYFPGQIDDAAFWSKVLSNVKLQEQYLAGSNTTANGRTATALPAISGTVTVGQTVTAAAGTWNASAQGAYPVTYTYQWQRCDQAVTTCTDVGAASSTNTRVLVNGDAGYRIRAVVTATNSGGSNTATSAATTMLPPVNTAAPVISGTTQEGETLSTTNGTWTSGETPTYSYQWQRCDAGPLNCVTVGTNSPSYTLVQGDVGKVVRVAVSATNSGGSGAPATSTAVGPVITRVPVGAVLPMMSATVPTGYLVADGTAVDRTTYATLFAAIGTTYGAGNGTSTFNLPDLRDRYPLGAGARAAGTVVTGTTSHGHTLALSAHSHGVTTTHSHSFWYPQHRHQWHTAGAGPDTKVNGTRYHVNGNADLFTDFEAGQTITTGNAAGSATTTSATQAATVAAVGRPPWQALRYMVKYDEVATSAPCDALWPTARASVPGAALADAAAGSTTCGPTAIPNMGVAFPAGAGPALALGLSGGGPMNHSVTVADAAHTLSVPSHTHAASLPNHQHLLPQRTVTGGAVAANGSPGTDIVWRTSNTLSGLMADGSANGLAITDTSTAAADSDTHSGGGSTFNSGPRLPPYLDLNFAAYPGSAYSVPPGTVVPYAGSVLPSGWLWADGTPVSRTTFDRLFTAIGTTFGAGDGTTTFQVPDLTDRYPLGADASRGEPLGWADGLATHQHAVTVPVHVHPFSLGHTHNVTFGAHRHTVRRGTDGSTSDVELLGGANGRSIAAGATPLASWDGDGTWTTGGGGAITSASDGGETATTSSTTAEPPSLVMRYIVKT